MYPSTCFLFLDAQECLDKVGKIQRDFLWDGCSLERKCHLVKWNQVCSSKDKGGLGIRKLDLHNRALLGKWVWKSAKEEDAR